MYAWSRCCLILRWLWCPLSHGKPTFPKWNPALTFMGVSQVDGPQSDVRHWWCPKDLGFGPEREPGSPKIRVLWERGRDWVAVCWLFHQVHKTDKWLLLPRGKEAPRVRSCRRWASWTFPSPLSSPVGIPSFEKLGMTKKPLLRADFRAGSATWTSSASSHAHLAAPGKVVRRPQCGEESPQAGDLQASLLRNWIANICNHSHPALKWMLSHCANVSSTCNLW